jgi:NADPH2:quinone reductase
MQAIRVHEFGAAEVMRLEEVPDPTPGAGEVLVRIHAAGVNPVDTYIRSGQYASKPALPYTPGTDAGGVVEAVGEGVDRVTVGQRVYVGGSKAGTYAEMALCAPDQVHPIPESITFSQAAGMNVPYATAFRALVQRAKAVEGETVLVHGATGGVGVAAVQIARNRGMTVIGTGGSEEGRQMILKQGAHHALDHHAPDYLQQVIQLTGGRGVDVVLEMAAHLNLGKVLSAVASAGRVVVIGSRGPVEINPRDLMSRDAAVMGMVLFLTPAKELIGVHAALVAGLDAGFLRPVIDAELPLAEAPEAHRRVLEGRSHGKIALIP